MAFAVLSAGISALHRVAAQVGDDQLDHPTPCQDWTVAQVVAHAAGDQHAWASAVGGAAPPSYNPFDPPRRPEDGLVALVDAAAQAAAATWAGADPGAPTLSTPLPPVPELPPELAAAAAGLDAAVHAWDVAVATGQESPLTPGLAKELWAAAEATAEPLRGFAYAEALPEQPGDDEAAALLRFLGRDPAWGP